MFLFERSYPPSWKLYYSDLGRASHYADRSSRSACKLSLLTDFNYVAPRELIEKLPLDEVLLCFIG